MASKSNWLLLAATLPGREASSARVRLWRGLKELGAANLRDGVTLVPEGPGTRERLSKVISDIDSDGGSAWLFELPAQAPDLEARLRALFDRAEAYQALEPQLAELRSELKRADEATARRRLRQIERSFDSIVAVDFFPGLAQARSRERLVALRQSINLRFSPEEPASSEGSLERRSPQEYHGQRWATRQRLWVDRAASAWLIRRFIDPHATFLWLAHPSECPADAHGFDFDGAAFTHVGDLVTFEVLLESFGLEGDIGLMRIGRIVHYLDVGGEQVPEAAGLEAVLAGLRESAPDDDCLLAAVTPVLDALYVHFSGAER